MVSWEELETRKDRWQTADESLETGVGSRLTGGRMPEAISGEQKKIKDNL
jgi:hypothetical protein